MRILIQSSGEEIYETLQHLLVARGHQVILFSIVYDFDSMIDFFNPDAFILHDDPSANGSERAEKIYAAFRGRTTSVIQCSLEKNPRVTLLPDLVIENAKIDRHFVSYEFIHLVEGCVRNKVDANISSHSKIIIDRSSLSIMVDERMVELTRAEFSILDHFFHSPNVVITRAELLGAVRARSDVRVIDVHIARVRQKLGGFGRSIKTIYGVGYVFRPHVVNLQVTG